MTGVKSLFPRSSFVGFDHLFNELDHVARHANDSYPPHNVIKTSDDEYLIELAVAGFDENELTVEVKDRTLSITGEHPSKGRDYVHRGISTKKFKRTFRLSEHVHVNGADFRNGLLAINLKYVIPESMRSRQIPIGKNEVSNDTHSSNNTSTLLTESNRRDSVHSATYSL